jgi:hypothetical protein
MPTVVHKAVAKSKAEAGDGPPAGTRTWKKKLNSAIIEREVSMVRRMRRMEWVWAGQSD